jgi:hypothetical protein
MNERNEPIHIHCEKVEKSCKYWLDVEHFDIVEAYHYNLTGSDIRQIRRLIFQHFDLIVQEWERIQHEKDA